MALVAAAAETFIGVFIEMRGDPWMRHCDMEKRAGYFAQQELLRDQYPYC